MSPASASTPDGVSTQLSSSIVSDIKSDTRSTYLNTGELDETLLQQLSLDDLEQDSLTFSAVHPPQSRNSVPSNEGNANVDFLRLPGEGDFVDRSLNSATDDNRDGQLLTTPHILPSISGAFGHSRKKLTRAEHFKAEETPTIISSAKFGNFMILPVELRQQIYEEVLVSNKPVLPRLCQADSCGAIKFHDKNQHVHNAMFKRLAITEVSNQVRAESLPIFYGSNTFEWGLDTLTYLERLSHLDRFRMVHHVMFPVRFYRDDFAARALRDVQRIISDQEKYERGLQSQHPNREFDWRSATYSTLERHPLHLASGFYWIAPFLIMRKLSIAGQDSGDGHKRQLVLHIPTEVMSGTYEHLEWFQTVARGLGLELTFVRGADVKWIDQRSGFVFDWVQKYQKKDVIEQRNAQGFNAAQILENIKQLFSNILPQRHPKSTSYYRTVCRKVGSNSSNIEWYTLNYDN